MVSAAARNGGSQSGMALLLSRKRSVSPGRLRRIATGFEVEGQLSHRLLDGEPGL